MNNREVIQVLNEMRDEYNSMSYEEYINKAVNKAIASLEAWDKVIEEIKKYCRNGCDYPYDMCESCKVDNIFEIIEKCRKEIEE